MQKRIVSVLLCLVFLFSLTAIPVYDGDITVNAEGIDYGDRILYGGLAVDIGDCTVFSENGALWRRNADNSVTYLADADARYLNYFDGKLYFTIGNKIACSDTNGQNLTVLRELEGEVKCLYVARNELLYLVGDSVYADKGGLCEKILTKSGMVGFVPQPDGTIRWAVKNPDYVYIEENGDESYSEGADELLQYVSSPNGDVALPSVTAYTDYGTELAASDYSGPQVTVGNVTLPLADHMPGTYFSKNGRACTCHNTSSTYCIQSVGNCNCMRYYPTGYKETCEIDLLGAQCFAFARMVFWTCFGFIDHSMNESLYYSVGSLKSGAVTANSVKALLMQAATGAHIRLAAGHSVSILTMDEDFIVIYHGNAGGDGVTSSPCIVSTRRYTWEQFANAAAKGILYVNMPYNYPDSKEVLSKKEAGYYKLKSNLNLRERATTSSESLGVIPNGEIVKVTEIDGFWGKTEYDGKIGWVHLEFTTFYSREAITPSGEIFKKSDDGLLYAVEWKLKLDSFTEHFDKQSITVLSRDGRELSADEFVGTGCVVRLTVNGELLESATVCLAGDINGNGAVDVGDYILARRAYMETYTPSEIEIKATDVSGSGDIDVFDYVFLRRYFFTENKAVFSAFGNVE